MNARELLAFLVGIPSVSGAEAALADAFGALLLAAGFEVKRAGNNLWFAVGTSGGPRLLLNSHLDTVPVAAGWTREPYDAKWQDERLYGLGANDAKGCVAAMTMAALALREKPFDGEAVFAFTAEEETGGAGIATILDAIGPIDAALVGEPTGLVACTAQRGMLILRCLARGVSAHVAHARDAVNAIHVAARDIARVQAMTFEAHATLGATRAEVTQVRGGRARNQVPDECEFFVDIRTTPNLDHEHLANTIAAELESEVVVHSARYLPKATPGNSAVLAAVLNAGAKNVAGSATSSDWAFLGDVPAVKIGPGDTRRSHTPDEYLLGRELDEAAAFYIEAVLEYFEKVKHERAA